MPQMDCVATLIIRRQSTRSLALLHAEWTPCGRPALSVAGPMAWNHLPDYLCDPSLNSTSSDQHWRHSSSQRNHRHHDTDVSRLYQPRGMRAPLRSPADLWLHASTWLGKVKSIIAHDDCWRGLYLPYLSLIWVGRWINHLSLWCMASVTYGYLPRRSAYLSCDWYQIILLGIAGISRRRHGHGHRLAKHGYSLTSNTQSARMSV